MSRFASETAGAAAPNSGGKPVIDDLVKKMRAMLLGRDSNLLSMFNSVVCEFESQIAAEKKRADDAIDSLNNIRKDFPQQARNFKTGIGSKG